MSNIPHIKNRELRSAVEKAVEIGFRVEVTEGRSSGYLIWQGAKERVPFSFHATEYRGIKNFIAQCERVAGRKLFDRPNAAKFRHEATREYFDPRKRDAEDNSISFQVGTLVQEYIDKGLELRIIWSASEHIDKNEVPTMVQLVSRIVELEKLLTELHQPIPDIGLPILTEDYDEYRNRIRFS